MLQGLTSPSTNLIDFLQRANHHKTINQYIIIYNQPNSNKRKEGGNQTEKEKAFLNVIQPYLPPHHPLPTNFIIDLPQVVF